MEEIEKQIRKLADELECISKLKRSVAKKIIKACLGIVELAEKGRISKTEADRLFGYFLANDDLLPEELHNLILDGASLELPAEALKERPEVSMRNIKERLLRLKQPTS